MLPHHTRQCNFLKQTITYWDQVAWQVSYIISDKSNYTKTYIHQRSFSTINHPQYLFPSRLSAFIVHCVNDIAEMCFCFFIAFHVWTLNILFITMAPTSQIQFQRRWLCCTDKNRFIYSKYADTILKSCNFFQGSISLSWNTSSLLLFHKHFWQTAGLLIIMKNNILKQFWNIRIFYGEKKYKD